jgi:replicative DNA helicase
VRNRPLDTSRTLIVLGPLEALFACGAGISGDARRELIQLLAAVAALKRLAHGLGVAILLEPGVSPDVPERPNQDPLLSDLPAHGAVTHICDATLFLCSAGRSAVLPAGKALAQVVVAHNRGRPLGSAELCFAARTGRFVNRWAHRAAGAPWTNTTGPFAISGRTCP